MTTGQAGDHGARVHHGDEARAGGDHDGRLHCVRTWRAGARADEFQALSESLALEPGQGLPGRVLASAAPAWLMDGKPIDARLREPS